MSCLLVTQYCIMLRLLRKAVYEDRLSEVRVFGVCHPDDLRPINLSILLTGYCIDRYLIKAASRQRPVPVFKYSALR